MPTSTNKRSELNLADDDGCKLQISPVYGFGQPMVAVFVEQDGDTCGVNLTYPQLAGLRDWIGRLCPERELGG